MVFTRFTFGDANYFFTKIQTISSANRFFIEICFTFAISIKYSDRMNWKKYVGIAIFALLLVAAGAVWYRYYYNFSEGYRSGTVLKVSHKGKLFKTWEGQLQLDQMGNKIWDFSVYDDSAILEQLKNASIDGHRVTLIL
jgi:hypothetical protein